MTRRSTPSPAGLAVPLTIGLLSLLAGAAAVSGQEPAAAGRPSFPWPEGKKAALSLTFDDARESQVDVGIPLLDEHGVRATFYVLPEGARKRLAGWKAALAKGHEVGNHSSSHPCTGNFAFSRTNALEDYTLERLEADVAVASAIVAAELGRAPTAFAYPCGQSFVGRGGGVRSYVPVVARLFRTGRLYMGEDSNDPGFCDPAQLLAVNLDGLSFDEVRPIVDKAVAEGRWLILAGHEIGKDGYQTTRAQTLAALCRHAKDPANGIWIDTVEAVAAHVLRRRAPIPSPAAPPTMP
jgi:peptidoglycan/xylan/chitin deacetylase (PgdA/CDA1 family)